VRRACQLGELAFLAMESGKVPPLGDLAVVAGLSGTALRGG
jgi:hypothetical protein